jgi:DNA topoisomerase-1
MRIRKLPNAAVPPEELAHLARLRYVSDEESGFARERNGSGFVYVNPRGRRVRQRRQLKRIEELAIPPAWRDVWICQFAKGHLQATGRDSRQRKQYIYHPRWREISNLVKFWRLWHFGRTLPALRRAVARDLRKKGLKRERVLAGVVGLLDATSTRVGNEEYVQQNNSYGLTTLRDRHVTVGRGSVEIRFVGKGGFRKEAVIDDKTLMRLLKECRAVRGAHLFQYRDDAGKSRAIGAADVNDYLREITGREFTAKDFRTWKASALVAGKLYEYRDLDRLSKRRRILKTAVDDAAASLGNTPTIAKKYYIHPGLLESYQDGTFAELFGRFRPRRKALFSHEEQVLARFLQAWETAPRRG